MRIFSAFRLSEWTMKRKLTGYMLLLVSLILLTLISFLFLFGRFNTVKESIYETLDIQMEVFTKDVSTHFDRLSSSSIRLSQDTAAFLDDYMAEKGLSSEDLNDSDAVMTDIQNRLTGPLSQKMLRENCSGIFVVLDTAENINAADSELSRPGIYLRRNGSDAADDGILLYRGLTESGRQQDIEPHTKWKSAFETDLIPDSIAFLFGVKSDKAPSCYYISERFTLPGTSEDVIQIVSPVISSEGNCLGICGYEVSADYFAAYHAQPSRISHLTFLLTESYPSCLDTGCGLSCGVSESDHQPPAGLLETKEFRNDLLRMDGSETSYIGIKRDISLVQYDETHTLAVMIPKSDYDRAVTRSVLKNIILWALILFFTVSCCIYFSRRFLAPILKDLEQIKSGSRSDVQSSIPEINDLCLFLAEQDREYESSMNMMELEKQAVQEEKEQLRREYEEVREVFEKAQDEYIRAQGELEEARLRLDRLVYSRKKEIDPNDFQNFLSGIQTLTKTEREIFDLYLKGKTAKEMLELFNIKESTLKYHNHNILSKLGVSSRKQMLRFAALIDQQNIPEE